MQLDSLTLLLTTVVILVLLGCALLFFWQRDRRSTWLMWWGGAFVLAGLTAGAYAHPNWGTDYVPIAIGNALRIATFALLFVGARAFGGRPLQLWIIPAVLGVWIALCLYPPFFASMPARVVAASLLTGSLILAAAWEFWRDRSVELPSRTTLIAVLCPFAVFMLIRVPLVGIAPFPFGAQPVQPIWVAVFNLTLFGHTFFLGLLFIALTKERSEREHRQKSLIDPLTGLMNRRAFMEHTERSALHRPNGTQDPGPTALLIFDLDHFKDVNDRFGHDAGDRVIAAFGSVALTNTRPTDSLYRLGGEEFCCVLPNTDVSAARRIAERIREAFNLTVKALPGAESPTTVSVGIAVADHRVVSLEALLAAADSALYEAKSRGRNRVVVADPVVIGGPDDPRGPPSVRAAG